MDLLFEKNMQQDSVICACFEATDIVKNSARKLACFQRSALEAVIENPLGDVWFTKKDFDKGMRAKAVITSDIPITECNWAIVDRNNTEAHRARLPKGQGKIKGHSCAINEPMSFEAIPEGGFFFVVEAKDLSGRILSEGPMGRYQHYSQFRVAAKQ